MENLLDSYSEVRECDNLDKLKRVVAIMGVAFGSLALFYIFFAWSLTLKNFGLSVEAQLIAQRIITPLLFAAFGALAVSCEYFRRVRLRSGAKTGILVRILRLVAVVDIIAIAIQLCVSAEEKGSTSFNLAKPSLRMLQGFIIESRVQGNTYEKRKSHREKNVCRR